MTATVICLVIYSAATLIGNGCSSNPGGDDAEDCSCRKQSQRSGAIAALKLQSLMPPVNSLAQ